ncbi:hypothetical protein EDC04DRAFT_2906990 [Pisolithus marmoratus]|nr:hypothetical protein EDC04DRAFT_2906990 [Pisolithus marmoratus]
MKYSLRQNRSSSRYQPYLAGLACQPSPSSSSSSNFRRARLTRSNAVILDRNFGHAQSTISAPSCSSIPKSITTSFDSAGPPPDTSASTIVSRTTDLTTTTVSETHSSTTSFKTAVSDHREDKSVPADDESYFSASSASVVLVNPSPPMKSVPISLNLPLAFKQSVQRAVQRRLRRYAGKLDPHTAREVEASISDAVDLALRILERSHRPQNMPPLVGTSASDLTAAASMSAHHSPAIIGSVLCDVINNALQSSLKAIRSSGRHYFTVLRPRAAPKPTLTPCATPHTYEMARLDASMPQVQSPLVPGAWDQDQD